jgi:hypothetical protein
MVNFDGRNRYPGDEPWLTDGYGDYVRHFLRAMDAIPSLAPPDEDHILSSTSIIQEADYEGNLKKYYGLGFENVDSSKVKLFYRTFDLEGNERIKLKKKPSSVLLENKPMNESIAGEGYEWRPISSGGLLIIRRENGKKVILMK